MILATILNQQAVKSLSGVSSKKRLMHEIANIGAAMTGRPVNEICAGLLDRENLGPTGFGHGVALPHTRLEGISGVQGVFLKLEQAIDFESVDRKPVDLVFALFAPEEAGTEHLKALALVSRTLRDSVLCEKLRANSDSNTLYTLLTEARVTQAA